MPEHQFSYPRVVPAPAKKPGRAPGGRTARMLRSPRDLVAESLVRRPPRDGAAPRSGAR
jgi:hypothetical protein